jgi:hypothetical protein
LDWKIDILITSKGVLMRKLTAILVVLSLCVFSASVLAADTQTADEKDILEVNVFGGLSQPMSALKNWHDSLGAKMGFNTGFHVGCFLSSNLVLGAMFQFNQYAINSSDSKLEKQHHRLYSPAVYLKYHFFSASRFVPFVEANVGADFVKFSTLVTDDGSLKYRELGYKPAFAYGIGGGVFYYTSDYSGFFVQAGYHGSATKKAWKEYQGNTYYFGQ